MLTYPEAITVGVLQGISELFPISSLGHAILIPALVGGRWAEDLSVSAAKSPYLAFVVGLHVATAVALIVFFWRDWVRVIVGFASSIRDRRVETADQRLAWILIVATIPVGVAGLVLEHTFRTMLGKPIPAAIFLLINGGVLYLGERLRQKGAADEAGADNSAEASDDRIAERSFVETAAIGAVQILALLPGISRSGVTMVAGLFRGLSHEDAARFSFLLATPVIFAAGFLKLPELFGPLGDGIHGQILLGSLAAGVCSYLSVRFLVRYFETRTLTPFAIYCVVAGLGSLVWLTVA